MSYRSLCRRSIAVLAAIFAAFSFVGSASADQKDQAYFIDILHLREGKTLAHAKAYFDAIEPIVAKHGLKRVDPAFAIAKVMRGDEGADIVNVWTVSSPEQTFDKVFSDPDYVANIPVRSATFDMSRAQMILMMPAEW